MLRWTLRMLMAAIASVLLVSAGGAAAGALATETEGGAAVPGSLYPAPLVIPSPERPAGAVALPHVTRPD